MDKQNQPDLIISNTVLEHQNLLKFEKINDLIPESGEINKEFYQGLKKLGQINNELRALPLNFTLPTVFFSQSNNQITIPEMFYSIDKLIDDSIKLNQMKNNRYQSIGYSPVHNQEIFYYISELFGAHFSYNKVNSITWNDENLDKSISFFNNWQTRLEQKLNDFYNNTVKYFNAPPYQLILENTLGLYLYPSSILYKIPEEKLNNLDFRWLSRNEKIFIGDDIIAAGIPLQAKNKEGAKHFLKWYLSIESQEMILKSSYQKRLSEAGGFFNGFSVLKVINEKVLPNYNHRLLDKIPQEDFLQFPEPFSPNWSEFKNSQLLPWLISALSIDEKEDKKPTDLLNFFKE